METASQVPAQVGFQGLRGAYSEMAIERYFTGQVANVEPLASFEAVFQALVEGRISDAVLPFENSLAGMIHDNLDLLAQYPVEIRGEQILEVQHCLLVPPGRSLSDVKRVISHPQALAQCAGYLKQHGIKAEAFFDTAGAAEHLGREKTGDLGAIASLRAASLYQLDVAAKSIADRGHNFTRFLHLTRQGAPARPLASRSGRSISFILLKGSAGLGPVCNLLEQAGLGVFHCEARPSKEAAWHYFYFCEVLATPDHPAWQQALASLAQLASQVRVLGTYPSLR